MLRITTRMDRAAVIFELEGKLMGPWVNELEQCWRQLDMYDQPLKIALQAVTFIDPAGKKLLTEMRRNGAELAGEGCMIKAIIDEIEACKDQK
jgi:translation initiation factor IF-2